LERAFSGGFLYQAVYTFSRNIDNNSGEIEANQTRYRWNKRADRGLSAYNQKHRFASNFVYELPFGTGKRFGSGAGALERKLLSGWQAQGIVVISTGFPFTPTANSVHNTGSFIPQFADRIADGNLPHDQRSPNLWFDTTAFARPAVGTLGSSGRNVLIGPGVGNFDFSLIKDTRMTERVMLQLRAESFNLFNHALFNAPDGNVDNRTFGQISAAGDPRRLQFALKLLF
jgi:hypothetical protein